MQVSDFGLPRQTARKVPLGNAALKVTPMSPKLQRHYESRFDETGELKGKRTVVTAQDTGAKERSRRRER
jgi:hypothetical protein